MGMPIPILGGAPPPQFPQTNLNINPNGMQLTVMLAPGIAFTVNCSPDTLDNIVEQWKIEKRKHMEMMRAINNGKG
jgi:riboflavin synthase alpha subunit